MNNLTNIIFTAFKSLPNEKKLCNCFRKQTVDDVADISIAVDEDLFHVLHEKDICFAYLVTHIEYAHKARATMKNVGCDGNL